MGRFSINSGQIVDLFPARGEPLLGALVALDEVRLLANMNLRIFGFGLIAS